MMDVRSLATARPDMAAYELTGTDLQALQHEARRLCPQGADVLRQAGHGQARELADSRTRALAMAVAGWADRPDRSAQLVVLCRAGALPAILAPLPAPPVEPEARAETSAALPIGPITPEW